MTNDTRLDEKTAVPRSRRAAWVAGGVALAIVLVAAVMLVRRDARGRPGTAAQRAPDAGGMAEMPDMTGMPGMATGGDGAVRLTADQLRQFGVTFATVEERALTTAVRAPGIVTVDERRLTTVAPRVGGFVERLLVRTSGERVQRGQPLAAIYAPEVLAAEEELLVARRLAGTLGQSDVPGVPTPSTDLVGAARRRLLLMGVSDAEIDAVLRSGRASRTVTLRAPASGVVLERRVTEVQAVAPVEALYTLADLSRVWVDVDVRESDAAAVRVGTGADLALATYPGRTVKGRVTFVYPTADPAARTVRARVEVANGDGRLRPGAYATVHLSTPTRRALTIPASAVVRTGERSLVFMDMGSGRLMPHDVETGRVAGELVEVLAGLAPGQRVVTSAQYLLESESNLADVMRAMMGQTGAQEMSGMQGMGGMEGMPGMDAKGADTRGLPPAGSPARPQTPRR